MYSMVAPPAAVIGGCPDYMGPVFYTNNNNSYHHHHVIDTRSSYSPPNGYIVGQPPVQSATTRLSHDFGDSAVSSSSPTSSQLPHLASTACYQQHQLQTLKSSCSPVPAPSPPGKTLHPGDCTPAVPPQLPSTTDTYGDLQQQYAVASVTPPDCVPEHCLRQQAVSVACYGPGPSPLHPESSSQNSVYYVDCGLYPQQSGGRHVGFAPTGSCAFGAGDPTQQYCGVPGQNGGGALYCTGSSTAAASGFMQQQTRHQKQLPVYEQCIANGTSASTPSSRSGVQSHSVGGASCASNNAGTYKWMTIKRNTPKTNGQHNGHQGLMIY